jgi:hypothetical protein
MIATPVRKRPSAVVDRKAACPILMIIIATPLMGSRRLRHVSRRKISTVLRAKIEGIFRLPYLLQCSAVSTGDGPFRFPEFIQI